MHHNRVGAYLRGFVCAGLGCFVQSVTADHTLTLEVGILIDNHCSIGAAGTVTFGGGGAGPISCSAAANDTATAFISVTPGAASGTLTFTSDVGCSKDYSYDLGDIAENCDIVVSIGFRLDTIEFELCGCDVQVVMNTEPSNCDTPPGSPVNLVVNNFTPVGVVVDISSVDLKDAGTVNTNNWTASIDSGVSGEVATVSGLVTNITGGVSNLLAMALSPTGITNKLANIGQGLAVETETPNWSINLGRWDGAGTMHVPLPVATGGLVSVAGAFRLVEHVCLCIWFVWMARKMTREAIA